MEYFNPASVDDSFKRLFNIRRDAVSTLALVCTRDVPSRLPKQATAEYKMLQQPSWAEDHSKSATV